MVANNTWMPDSSLLMYYVDEDNLPEDPQKRCMFLKTAWDIMAEQIISDRRLVNSMLAEIQHLRDEQRG